MRKLIVLILLAALMYAAAMYRSVELMSLAVAGVLLCLVMLAITVWQAAGAKVTFAAPVFLHRGSFSAPVKVRIRQKSPFPAARGLLRLKLRYDGEAKERKLWVRGSIDPKSETWECPIPVPLYGLADVRLTRIHLFDPLGLFAACRRVKDSMKMAVFPDGTAHEPAEDPDNARGVPLESAAADLKRGSGGDIFQIRDYRTGDTRKQIHWKLSARLMTLVVREWEDEASRVVSFRLASPEQAMTAEEASAFYEKLENHISGFLAQGFSVRTEWTDPDGSPAWLLITGEEGLSDFFMRLYDSRFCFAGGNRHA